MTTQASFTLDLNRCTGCSACAVACSIENDVSEGLAWREIHTYNPTRHPSAPTFHLSLACNHCADPACLRGCPAAAYTKDTTTGAVLLNQEHCIGCGYCSWVCPYDAPQFNASAGVMEKCTFCSPRLERGLEPACVNACPVDALGFNAQAQPAEQSVPGFPNAGLGPAITFTPKNQDAAPAAGDGPALANAAPPRPRLDLSRLRSEWPLLAFSLVVTAMAGGFGGAVLSGSMIPPQGGVALGLAGLAAMLVSTLHLGRPARAWRAILNVRTSWVSREILFFSLFWATASGATLLALPKAMHWLAASLGFLTLVCIDLVYRVPGQRYPAVPHGAMTSLTAAFIVVLTLPVAGLAVLLGGIKLALYPWRDALAGDIPYALSTVRLAGLLVPIVVLLAVPEPTSLLQTAGLIGVALGELADRIRFYAELDFMTPARQLEQDAVRG